MAVNRDLKWESEKDSSTFIWCRYSFTIKRTKLWFDRYEQERFGDSNASQNEAQQRSSTPRSLSSRRKCSISEFHFQFHVDLNKNSWCSNESFCNRTWLIKRYPTPMEANQVLEAKSSMLRATLRGVLYSKFISKAWIFTCFECN